MIDDVVPSKAWSLGLPPTRDLATAMCETILIAVVITLV